MGHPWLLIKMDDEWQAVIPDNDTEPHARVILDLSGEKIAPLADFTCPCNPKIDFSNKIIIHNAFDGRE
jgi:hypothetical protein